MMRIDITALEVRGPKIKVWAVFLLEGPGRGGFHFLAFSGCLGPPAYHLWLLP